MYTSINEKYFDAYLDASDNVISGKDHEDYFTEMQWHRKCITTDTDNRPMVGLSIKARCHFYHEGRSTMKTDTV